MLVWREPEVDPSLPPAPNLSPQQQAKYQHKKEQYNVHLRKRALFEENLKKEGLVLEEDHVANVPLR